MLAFQTARTAGTVRLGEAGETFRIEPLDPVVGYGPGAIPPKNPAALR